MNIDWILFAGCSLLLSVIVVFVMEEAYSVFISQKSKEKDNNHV